MPNINEQILNLQREPLIVGAGGAVNSVNGQTGDVVLTAEDVGALPDTTVIPTKTSELTNDSNFATTSDISEAVDVETTAREGADNDLQSQIDAISAASDVKDVVGTYAELEAYDTSTLGNNDIIKVLEDEEENDATTYYRWDAIIQKFTLIGEEGPYYTKAGADAKFQDKLTAGTGINIDANNEISTTGPSGIPTDATFWGASYDSTNNRVQGDIIMPASIGAIRPYAMSNTQIGFDGNNQFVLSGIQTQRITSVTPSSSNEQTIFQIRGQTANQRIVLQGAVATQTLRVSGVTDPTAAQDAATKNYVDIQVGNIETILQTINSGTGV